MPAKAPSPAGVADQLEGGLRVAVLEVLPAQSEAVDPQQQLASGVGHEGDFIDGPVDVRGARREPGPWSPGGYTT